MSQSFDPHATTILAVRRKGSIAIGGDGQVTLGNTVMKSNARKVRRPPTARSWPPAGRPMPSRCSSAREAGGSGRARGVRLAKDGVPTVTCAGWGRCCWWATRRACLISGNGV